MAVIYSTPFWFVPKTEHGENSDFSTVVSLRNAGQMQEICDNGIDDDMDGLIDLQDDDCVCEPDWSYYITNPDFEDTLRCPCEDLGGMCIGLAASTDAAYGWLDDDSWNGADYWNACFDYNLPGVGHEIPLPVPNGNGVMGFRANGPLGMPPNKEYIAQCLPRILQRDTSYKISFDVGFPRNVPDDVTIAIFGTDDCNNWPLPFDTTSGGTNKPCPASFPGWVELGSVNVRKQNGAWTIAQIDFIPNMDIRAIAIGGGCQNLPFGNLGDYYFINDLELTRSALCDINIQLSELCAGDATLGIAPLDSAVYQWYKDSIALVGETSFIYALPRRNPDGMYQIKVNLPEGCFMSNPFDYRYSAGVTLDTVSICQGDVYDFGGSILTAPGDYIDTLRTIEGCDSIVHLRLSVRTVSEVNNAVSICRGDVYTIGNSMYSDSGTYVDTLTNTLQCDSIVRTVLTVLPVRSQNLIQTICSGESYQVGSSSYDMSGSYTDTLLAINGCDSIVQLNLTVQERFDTLIDLLLCPNEVLILDGELIDEPGRYTFDYLTVNGCDSIVTYRVQGAISPISLPNLYEGTLGSAIFIAPNVDYALIDSIWWHPNEDITFDLSQVEQSVLPLRSTLLILEAIDRGGCSWKDSVRLIISAPYKIFIPNAFTPNADGTNDRFFPFLNQDVEQILRFQIFNRWGDRVYSDQNISVAEMGSDDRGWDGSSPRGVSPVGVYVYVMEVRFIDGQERLFKGDVTLLR